MEPSKTLVKNMETKKLIRKKARSLRSSFAEEKVSSVSQQICIKLLEQKWYNLCDTILVYASIGQEISLSSFIERAWKDGKRIAFPRVSGDAMDFYYVYDVSFLEKGCFGIPEPKETCAKAFPHGGMVMLIPGLTFSAEGQRIGYGKGYYDRYLKCHNGIYKIGICYDELLTQAWPEDEYDVSMDYVITEKKGIEIMTKLEELCKNAREARIKIGMLDTDIKNNVLRRAADCLMENAEEILAANAIDVENGKKNLMPEGLIDRLTLTQDRIADMADGLRQIAKLDDPVGEVLSMKKRPNGLIIGKRRVPLGVIGIIYEARPNVTSDAFGLCFKTGNCVILKGGSDAINSNKAVVKALKQAIAEYKLSDSALNLIESTDRETTTEFMKMDKYIDLLIPRGGAGLINNVVKNSTVPVIQTGTGNCHIYVDAEADFDMALDIITNAKTQRIGVCNACESIVLHKSIAQEFLPLLYERLKEHHVELRCDDMALNILSESDLVKKANEEDWGTEYLDYIMSVKIVKDMDEAIAHINKYTTFHSEAIITKDYDRSQRFLDEIDSACVYVNASTRFSDGNEFGFGAEIGISTQKLHARGPMGLEALTSYKYIIYGNGQIRE